MTDPLDAFLPAVRDWFRGAFPGPTSPQALGWPAIQRGEDTLILSPTGSGKTLAAFLWGIDELYREALELGRVQPGVESRPGPVQKPRGVHAGLQGVRLLYISPLKALNNDVERNLRSPLAGIRRLSEEMGAPLPRLDVLVRTGDTPSSVRQQMARRPPPILITTPESLYLLLTSPLARTMFRTVRAVIVDEIHTLVGNKRGAHLALSLERLDQVVRAAADQSRARGRVQRIGLSATQRPLDEVARFLGGYGCGHEGREAQDGRISEWPGSEPGSADLEPRPVTVVDAGMVKPMDLRVVTAVDDLDQLPGGSIWPAVIPQVLDLVQSHHTTLVFANSRRQAERAADRMNQVYLARQTDAAAGPEALAEGGVVKGGGMFGTGATGGPFRAHHGSVSREARQQLEVALKEGALPALVGTSSLELGIDIGSIDLVVQLQSPRSVTQGLQRVGRAGHRVGETSVGRIFPTHREDLLEAAAVARAMARGDVEPTYTPQNCLDVLAQQIVAMVAVEDWDVPALFRLVRRAHPFARLTPDLLRSVLDMLAGRYPGAAFRELRPRIAWDRVHDRLAALPGSRLLAIRNGGTIPDRGTFGAYLPDRKTRLGELDEEFVFETQPGDVFTLGSSTWRVQEVTDDRVIVAPAPGFMPRMPFWRGDAVRRDYHLGLIYGRFRAELARRVVAQPAEEVEAWLQSEHYLDVSSARNAAAYVRRQVDVLGAISSDQTIIGELFTDPLGDLRLVIHSVFGARVNSAWALALSQAFREALGSQPEVMVGDDGILFRFLDADRDPPVSLIREMGPAEVRERLLAELPTSAVFGAHFRMNAARALLLPAVKGGQKRTPFWLQRLRAKDLLAAATGFQDFPIIAETYRDVLRDVLDLEHLEDVLRGIQSNQIQVITAETVAPSPVAAGLLHDLITQYMYESDQPKAERQMQSLLVGRDMLSQLLDEKALPDLLRPEALQEVDSHLQYLAEGARARTREELATVFLALGDLSLEEAVARCASRTPAGDPPDSPAREWLRQLEAEGRLAPIPFAGGARLVLGEQAAALRAAFFQREAPGFPDAGGAVAAPEALERDDSRRGVLIRCLSTHGPLSRDWLLDRYPWEGDWLDTALAALVASGQVARGQISPGSPSVEYCDRRTLERIHRRTLALLRREVEPVPVQAYAGFLARWQRVHPAERLSGPGALVQVLRQLRGAAVPGIAWERDVLRLRLAAFDKTDLEELFEQGDVVWVCSACPRPRPGGGRDPRRAHVRFVFRGEGSLFLPAEPVEVELSDPARRAVQFLKDEGASFFADLQAGTGLPARDLAAGLVEAATAGLVTNDSFQALRQVLAWAGEGEVTAREPLSSLHAELAVRRSNRDPVILGHRPVRRSVRGPQRAVADRIERNRPPRFSGRWSLVHRAGVVGRDVPPEERTRLQARQLLQCFGIVTRQSLEGDAQAGWDWSALYLQFQLMEMRGEVRRGFFVQGLPGVQFALPEAVERLREWSRPDAPGSGDLVLLNGCDPAVPDVPAQAGEGGIAGEPGRLARIPSNYLVLQRGAPVLSVELGAGRVTSLPEAGHEVARQAMALVLDHVGAEVRRLALSRWNGESIRKSPAAAILEGLGFRREALVYVWEATSRGR